MSTRETRPVDIEGLSEFSFSFSSSSDDELSGYSSPKTLCEFQMRYPTAVTGLSISYHPFGSFTGSDSYRVLSYAGEGHGGVVYKCQAVARGAQPGVVAIKVMPQRTSDKEVEEVRSRREYTYMHLVRGCDEFVNLVEVIDYPQELCLVEEFADKGDFLAFMPSLTRKSASGSQFIPEAMIRSVFAQIVLCLVRLREYDLVHRDIKLENFLVFSRSPCAPDAGPPPPAFTSEWFHRSFKLKLGDFGFMTDFSPDILHTEAIGTILYACPELLKSAPYLGPACDLWAAGVCLYLLCYGKFPFSHTSNPLSYTRSLILNDSLECIIRARGQSPEEALSSPCRALLARLLRKSFAQRLSSLDALLADPWLAPELAELRRVECALYARAQREDALLRVRGDNAAEAARQAGERELMAEERLRQKKEWRAMRVAAEAAMVEQERRLREMVAARHAEGREEEKRERRRGKKKKGKGKGEEERKSRGSKKRDASRSSEKTSRDSSRDDDAALGLVAGVPTRKSAKWVASDEVSTMPALMNSGGVARERRAAPGAGEAGAPDDDAHLGAKSRSFPSNGASDKRNDLSFRRRIFGTFARGLNSSSLRDTSPGKEKDREKDAKEKDAKEKEKEKDSGSDDREPPASPAMSSISPAPASVSPAVERSRNMGGSLRRRSGSSHTRSTSEAIHATPPEAPGKRGLGSMREKRVRASNADSSQQQASEEGKSRRRKSRSQLGVSRAGGDHTPVIVNTEHVYGDAGQGTDGNAANPKSRSFPSSSGSVDSATSTPPDHSVTRHSKKNRKEKEKN